MTDDNERKEQLKAKLFDKYNSRAMEQGYHLQGEYFLRTVSIFDELDDEWTEAWLTFIYDYMYGRRVLDDKTRTLIVVGECIAAGHTEQLPNHMRTAIEVGATPQELLEVCLQSAIYVGMPAMGRARNAFREVMNEMGLADFKEPPFKYSGEKPLQPAPPREE